MSFLDELASNNDENNNEQPKGDNRQLWESCFKYFQHFTSILQKEDKRFDSEFSLISLDTRRECQICGPYEIKRAGAGNELKLELKFNTVLKQGVQVSRNDMRSAEILKQKLSKDSSILSSVKKAPEHGFLVEINTRIPSIFKIILRDEKDFFVQYINIGSSSNRIKRLDIKNINEQYMDGLAKYILGKNPELYTEKISDQAITKIREKLELAKRLEEHHKAQEEARILAEKQKAEKEKHNKSKKSLFKSLFGKK